MSGIGENWLERPAEQGNRYPGWLYQTNNELKILYKGCKKKVGRFT